MLKMLNVNETSFSDITFIGNLTKYHPFPKIKIPKNSLVIFRLIFFERKLHRETAKCNYNSRKETKEERKKSRQRGARLLPLLRSRLESHHNAFSLNVVEGEGGSQSTTSGSIRLNRLHSKLTTSPRDSPPLLRASPSSTPYSSPLPYLHPTQPLVCTRRVASLEVETTKSTGDAATAAGAQNGGGMRVAKQPFVLSSTTVTGRARLRPYHHHHHHYHHHYFPLPS